MIGIKSGFIVEMSRLRTPAESYGRAYPKTGCQNLFGFETYVIEYFTQSNDGDRRIRKKEIQIYLDDGREMLFEIENGGKIRWLLY